MEKFETPEVKTIKFAIEDVITESSTDTDLGDGGLPMAP